MSDREREREIDRYERECRHFNGAFRNRRCEAGVAYDDFLEGPPPDLVVGTSTPATAVRRRRLPCLAEDGSPPCALRSPYTRQEAEAILDEHERVARNCLVARAAISRAIVPGTHSGQMECPVERCGGLLRYSIAPNGHVAACCTGSCGVNFME